MKWMKERDLLIAQTMAFVQSVTGKKPEAESMVVTSDALAPITPPGTADTPHPPAIEAVIAEAFQPLKLAASEEPKASPAVAFPEVPRAVQTIAQADLRSGFQSEISEIKARVANFRAHQQRFDREREAYCSATMAKVHATLDEMPGSPRFGK
jgi:hypothetical protein